MTTKEPKQYQPLYILKTNGKIYNWHIEIKQINNNYCLIHTSNGYIDGKKVLHEKEVREGKQKRTVLQQAEQICDKKFNDKIKEGYKDIIPDIGNESVDNTINKNTIRPMLAQNYDKHSKKIVYPCYVQPKLDGFRCLAYYDKTDNKVHLMTRTGTIINHFISIREDLKKFFETYPDIIIDGEIYSDDLTFQDIVGFVHLKDMNETKMEIMNEIKYHIFDYYDTTNDSENFNTRLKIMKSLFKKNKVKKNIKLVSTYSIEKQEEIKEYMEEFLKQNYEGIIIRNYESKYEKGKRSYGLQKYKNFFEAEYEIIGAKEAEGNDKGTVIWVCINEDGKEFSVRPKGTREERKKYYDNHQNYIGKKLTVIYQEFTNDNLPRFPVGKAIRENY